MKALVATVPVWVLGLVLAACRPPAKAPDRPPSAPARAAPPSLLERCLAVAEGREPVPVEALRRDPLIAKMAAGMAPQVRFTPGELAEAARSPGSDPRFSWDRLRRNRRYLSGFLAQVRGRERALVAEALPRASELLGVKVAPDSVALHFVCGGPWDAYVLIFDRGPELFFDLGYQADRGPAAALRDFKDILVHELWHLAFLKQQRSWKRQYRNSSDPATQFLYRLVNEGIGHYYSLDHRLHPRPNWPDFPARVQQVFALLSERYPAYLECKDEDQRRRLIWGSHAGVPLWQKWGAMPGALITDTLVQRLGRQRVQELIAEEPFSFVLAYQQLRRDDPGLPALPERLLADAKRLLDRHRSEAPTD